MSEPDERVNVTVETTEATIRLEGPVSEVVYLLGLEWSWSDYAPMAYRPTSPHADDDPDPSGNG